MYRIIKNIVDRVAALLLLVFLIVIPIFPIIMLLIFFLDGKNVFFYQKRIGKDGAEFRIVKFRTMHPEADNLIKARIKLGETKSLDFKKDADLEVTKLGRILRATSLDELPQLINIIKGDMSVVGPRPLQKFEVDEFVKGSQLYEKIMENRLQVKPGLLCYWQVLPNKEEVPFIDRMKSDEQYSKDISLITDFKLIFLGIETLFKRNNM